MRRGSQALPRLASFLLVPLVEHLQGVAIARDLPVFPRVLQAALQLVHFVLPLPVGCSLVEQIEQRHVNDLAAPDDHDLGEPAGEGFAGDRKSTRLNSSHVRISYAVFCLKKKKSSEQSPIAG